MAIHLTEREAQVLPLIAEGLTDRQIGARLFITGNTVHTHVAHLRKKFNTDSRTHLVHLAHREGLLS